MCTCVCVAVTTEARRSHSTKVILRLRKFVFIVFTSNLLTCASLYYICTISALCVTLSFCCCFLLLTVVIILS